MPKNLRLPLCGLLVLALVGLVALMIFSGGNRDGPKALPMEPEPPSVLLPPETPVSDGVPTGVSIQGQPSLSDATVSGSPTAGTDKILISGGGVPVSTGGAAHSPTGEPGVVDYTIQTGDMISKVAKKFGCKSDDIYKLNEGLTAQTASKVRVGQVIRVPDMKGVGGTPSSPVVAALSTAKENEKKVDSPDKTVAVEKSSPMGGKSATESRVDEVKSDAVRPASITPKPDFSKARKHKLAAGDTVFTLAKKYYGSVVHFKLIADANPEWDIAKKIEIGKDIVIPALPAEDGGATVERSGK